MSYRGYVIAAYAVFVTPTFTRHATTGALLFTR